MGEEEGEEVAYYDSEKLRLSLCLNFTDKKNQKK
jgi:hypothetical protein